MIKSNNSVEVRGTGNTVDFERVMNQFSSSFTESFLKVMESQFGIGVQSNVVEEVKPMVVKPKSKPKTTTPKSKTKNSGFEWLKNPILRTELEVCKTVDYDERKYITIKELGIVELLKGGKSEPKSSDSTLPQ